MRLREAILANLPRLHQECRVAWSDQYPGRHQRRAKRSIITNEEVKASLLLARNASPVSSHNLLHRAETYAAFLQRTVLPAREILHKHGIKDFHELRAAYACARYEQLTSRAAPVNNGHGYHINRDIDQREGTTGLM